MDDAVVEEHPPGRAVAVGGVDLGEALSRLDAGLALHFRGQPTALLRRKEPTENYEPVLRQRLRMADAFPANLRCRRSCWRRWGRWSIGGHHAQVRCSDVDQAACLL